MNETAMEILNKTLASNAVNNSMVNDVLDMSGISLFGSNGTSIDLSGLPYPFGPEMLYGWLTGTVTGLLVGFFSGLISEPCLIKMGITLLTASLKSKIREFDSARKQIADLEGKAAAVQAAANLALEKLRDPAAALAQAAGNIPGMEGVHIPMDELNNSGLDPDAVPKLGGLGAGGGKAGFM